MMCIAPIAAAPLNIQPVEVCVKPVETNTAAPTRRFTVSHCNRVSGINAATPIAATARPDAAVQKAQVEGDSLVRLAAFITAQERAATITESDRRQSTMMLLSMAAARDIAQAKAAGYPPQVIEFMQQTWAAFIPQARELYACDAVVPPTMELSRNALENISSIGVWFTGPQISLPLRRYTVQVVGPDGNLQNITAVGLLSFAYSSYVMQLRAMSQQSTLEHLARIQEQLGTTTLFLPQLLVASS